jgi:hypothetical protein
MNTFSIHLNHFVKFSLTFLLIVLSSTTRSDIDLPDPCRFNCGGGDRSSPWNFLVDFESDEWKRFLKPNDKGMGWKPFKIEKDTTGNSFVSITVKSGWNSDYGNRKNPTERSELETTKLKSFGKEVWYGFRVRTPEEFEVIRDRVLITQFKQHTKSRPSPMISVSQYDVDRPKIGISICGKSGGLGSNDTFQSTKSTPTFYCDKKRVTGSLNYVLTEDFRKLLDTDWSTVVIGSYVTNTHDGFVKIYYNQDLIYDYKGPTYGWDQIVSSNIRIGLYRDGHEFGGEYPPQTVHFDDFVIGSDLQDISQILWN